MVRPGSSEGAQQAGSPRNTREAMKEGTLKHQGKKEHRTQNMSKYNQLSFPSCVLCSTFRGSSRCSAGASRSAEAITFKTDVNEGGERDVEEGELSALGLVK